MNKILFFFVIALIPILSITACENEIEKIYFTSEQLVTTEDGFLLIAGDSSLSVISMAVDAKGIFAEVLKQSTEKIYFAPEQLVINNGLFLNLGLSLLEINSVSSDEHGLFAISDNRLIAKYKLICKGCKMSNPRWNYYCSRCGRRLSDATREAEKGDWR